MRKLMHSEDYEEGICHFYCILCKNNLYMHSMPPLHSTHKSNFSSLFIRGSTGAGGAREASDVWEALSPLWTRSADGPRKRNPRKSSRSVWDSSKGVVSPPERELWFPSAGSLAAVISCPVPALCPVRAPSPVSASGKPSRRGRVCSHTVQPSRTEGLVPNHLLGRGHAKLLNRAREGFGRVLIGRDRAVRCAKHSTARRSQCQCPGMFPGCISLDGASLCKSHCNKQIPLPKPNSFATKEHLLARLGIQKSTVNFAGV